MARHGLAAKALQSTMKMTAKDPEAVDKPLRAEEQASDVSNKNALLDLSRRNGDFAVCRYYFRSIGWSNVFAFGSFVAIYVFCLAFSRESSFQTYLSVGCVLLTEAVFFRNLA